MPKLFILIFFACFTQLGYCQITDFLLIKKKNGKTIQSFYKGRRITFENISGDIVNGDIVQIKNDSISVKIYDIEYHRQYIGGISIDTMNWFVVKTYYKDIKRIKLERRKASTLVPLVSSLLKIGSVGSVALNIINGGYSSNGNSSKTTKQLANAASTFLLGVIINYYYNKRFYTSRRHAITYVNLQPKVN